MSVNPSVPTTCPVSGGEEQVIAGTPVEACPRGDLSFGTRVACGGARCPQSFLSRRFLQTESRLKTTESFRITSQQAQ